MRKRVLIFLFPFIYAGAACSQQQEVVFKGALVYPVSGNRIENGIVIIKQGKIVSVGGPQTPIPDGALIRDMTGKIIMPGLVDTHSHLGSPDGGDNSSPLSPDTRVLDAVNPTSDGFKKALAGGVTTINIMPGSGLLMSGQTIYVKMRQARIIEDLLLVNEKGVYGGLKMANGTNPMRSISGYPGTRAKSAALVREQFLKAVEYQKKIEKAGRDSSKMPDRDLKLEPLLEVLSGKRTVHFHTHKANDVLTAIRLSKEFKFNTILHHVSEGWKVADEIAKSGYPCSIITIDAPGGKAEAMNLSLGTGAALIKAGATVGFHTDDGITDSRLFLRSAALMVREGMPREKALEALTINGARMLDLSKRLGSLENGKDADLLILSGDPFSVYTHVEETWVEGIKRYDIKDPKDKSFLTGGYEVYSPDRSEFHGHDAHESEDAQ